MLRKVVLYLATVFSITVFQYMASHTWVPSFEEYNVIFLMLVVIAYGLSNTLSTKYVKRVKKFILTVVVINLMLFTISYPLRSYSDKINRVKGDLIVLKLTEYRETHGNYPESLSFLDLNPTETSTISGSSFNYNLKGDAFELSYPSFRNMAGIKISGKSDWIYDY